MKDIKSLKLLLASPEDILAWSYGEVQNAETINYRSHKPEPGGLMCERIFGPTKDYECYCGKYKRKKYSGIVCDKCGVEVTTSKVRRERMGHIKLAVPVVHIWYAYGVPTRLAILLNMRAKDLASIIYYIKYVVTEVDEAKRQEVLAKIDDLVKAEIQEIEDEYASKIVEAEQKYNEAKAKLANEKLSEKESLALEKEIESLAKQKALVKKDKLDEIDEVKEKFKEIRNLVNDISYKRLLTEEEYRELSLYGLVFFKAEMGAPAIKDLLAKLDLKKLEKKLKDDYNVAAPAARLQIERRLKLVQGFLKNNTKPEWMVLEVLPVLPADLRPIVALPGGRFATSDLNDLYRRVINRNKRLKELMEIGAPEIILRNEKRMLQEAVDALIDNQHRFNNPVVSRTGIPLKSLTEILRGKKGRFRRNLLGKRVDYSGRCVISPDPTLKLDQCGLPKLVALEIFKPFVIHKLIQDGYATTINGATELIELKDDVIWDALESVIKNRVVLLNRPPSLHRYSIQAFYPVLVEGAAIKINPLVTAGFNADFDGDQMGVFAVLTDEALEETKASMLPRHNILKIADGSPIVSFSKDMALGIYELTYMREVTDTKKLKVFVSQDDVLRLYDLGELDTQEPIYLYLDGKKILTTPGRVKFNSVLPQGFRFVNETLPKKKMNALLREIVLNYSKEQIVDFLDKTKLLAFSHATKSGFSLGVEDIPLFKDKDKELKETYEKQKQIYDQYMSGLITKEEKDNMIIKIWQEASERLTKKVWEQVPDDNPLKVQVVSGANGAEVMAGQIMAMVGLVSTVTGGVVNVPIISSYAEGLNAFEYFVSARGGRKGMVDTALKTGKSGYLTRKLVDVSQDVIVRMDDCGYDGKGLRISREDERELSFADRLIGRFVTEDVVTKDGEVLVKKGEVITQQIASKIDKSDIQEVFVRSPIYCNAPFGVCRKCYGYDFSKYDVVELGQPVGVIAAQSISEPATQLTLRTFHSGGRGSDITQGLPRVVELFEARTPKNKAKLASVKGTVKVKGSQIIIEGVKTVSKRYVVEDDYKLLVKDGDEIKKGEPLFEIKDGVVVKAPAGGKVELKGRLLKLVVTLNSRETITVPSNQTILVRTGDKVEPGDVLTTGSIDPKEYAELKSVDDAQRYVIDEIQKTFKAFGIEVRDVHVEIIVHQMAKLAKIIDPGDTNLIRGSWANKYLLAVRNKLLNKQGKKPISYINKLLGISMVSLNADSVLAAISFEHQVRVLSEATILGRKDYLRGIKENVIIGRLIPVGKRAIIQDVTKLEEMQD